MGYKSGLYSGVKFKEEPIDESNPKPAVDRMDIFLEGRVSDNKADSIISVFMFPTGFAPTGELGDNVMFGVLRPIQITKEYSRTDAVDLYIPRNKKLLTFPYKFLAIDTLDDVHIYRYEWSNQTEQQTGRKVIKIAFKVALSPSPQIVCVPYGYNAASYIDGGVLDVEGENYTEAAIMTGFPQCPFAIDTYRAWLAQRGGPAGIAFSVLGGIAMSAVNPIAGGMGIANTIKETAVASTKGAKPKNVGDNGTIMGTRHYAPFVKQMSVNRQQAQVIDSFFDRYGYACEKIKIPNRNVRTSWTYCKTRDCAAHGNVPAEAMENIKKIYNNGITWWNKNADIGNYAQTNNVLT